MDRDLQGKVVVITGASSRIGRGAALAFARAGASMALGGRRFEEILKVETACASEGSEALSKETDVSDPIDVAELAQAALARFRRIDVWINNAGEGAVGRFDLVPLEEHVQVVDRTLLGPLYGSYVALRQFHKQRHGILINIAMMGRGPTPFYASQAAAGHGLIALGAALRRELADAGNESPGIRVCTILPDALGSPLGTPLGTPFSPRAARSGGRLVPPPSPFHDPEPVIEALLKVARQPQDETVVGSEGKRALLA